MTGNGLRLMIIFSALFIGALGQPGWARQKDQTALNQAKILMMEQKWEDARLTFQRLIREYPQSSLLSQAYYHSAYCLRLQKRTEEALLAYELFRQKFPLEPFFATEAGKAIVELSITMVEQGKGEYRSRLVSALADKTKDVRYFAAIRCSYLKDRQLNLLCVPILKEIRAKEKQQDLVTPASIALLKIEPGALSQPEAAKPAKSQPKSGEGTRMFYIQIYESGENKPPVVELKIPVSFAQLAIAALDEGTKADLRKKGFDVDNVWQSLNRLGPTDILTLRNGPKVVKIWIR